jgi:O-antigen/teichoic acid export membrane protein
MADSKTEGIPTIDHKPHAAFFRQSGWLMIANIGGGAMTWGVHFLAKRVPEAEYAAFGTLLMVVACLPTMPLQMILAQQTAQALATGRERQLASTLRLAWLGTFLVWALGTGAVLLFQNQIVAGWHLPSSSALWVTLPMILASLWVPVFSGTLQGRQDFFWMGWAMIIGSFGRFAVAAALVFTVACGATGMMAGAMCGMGVMALIAIWRTRDLWTLPAEKSDVRALLSQITPLLFGFGACQFMFTSDTMFAKAYFTGDEMAPYVAAGTLSRALLWLVLPLAAVMFPKLVHANVKSEKSNLFGMVVLGTAALAICGALGLWLVGPIVVQIVYKTSYVVETTRLLPWYAGAMVPLALANVMVNDLLARNRFGVVPWMVLLALGYGFTLPWMLAHYHRQEVVLQTLGAFNLLLFGICAWFAWGGKVTRTQTPAVR